MIDNLNYGGGMNKYFDKIRIAIKDYMILQEDDDHIIDILLATALSIELDQPIWVMITASPSSGKTVLLDMLSGLENYHCLHTLTPRALFSGHPSAQGGYMIREVKEKGILAFPDFTTVLKLNSKSRNEIFNQLRVIFDGKAGLGTGIDSGKFKVWEGKVAVIALVTEIIEKIKETSSDLGERFLYFKFSPDEKDFSVIENFNANEEARLRIPQMVREFINSKKDLVIKKEISKEVKKKIFYLSKFVSIARTTVDRNGYGRDIVRIHKPEEPFRVINLLSSAYKTLVTINENEKRTISVLINLATSSIPDIRKSIIESIYKSENQQVSIDELNYRLSETKIRRTAEDLVALDILTQTPTKKKNKFSYSINKNFRKYLEYKYY